MYNSDFVTELDSRKNLTRRSDAFRLWVFQQDLIMNLTYTSITASCPATAPLSCWLCWWFSCLSLQRNPDRPQSDERGAPGVHFRHYRHRNDLVIITAGIDLSVGSLLALTSCVAMTVIDSAPGMDYVGSLQGWSLEPLPAQPTGSSSPVSRSLPSSRPLPGSPCTEEFAGCDQRPPIIKLEGAFDLSAPG